LNKYIISTKRNDVDTHTIIDSLFKDNVSFHDVVYEAVGVSHSTEKLKEIFLTLPLNIQCAALEWGLNDTVFRDTAFTYIMEKKNG